MKQEYLVLGQGEDVTDMVFYRTDDLSDAFSQAHIYNIELYETEILLISEETNGTIDDEYKELNDIMCKYDSYNDFINNVQEDVMEYIIQRGLTEYINNYYDRHEVFEIMEVPQSIKLPIEKSVYMKLLKKLNGKTIQQYIMSIIQSQIDNN